MINKGYEICECGKYAYIDAAEILQRLPVDYVGELCPQCNLWMCDIRHLTTVCTELAEQAALEMDKFSTPASQ